MNERTRMSFEFAQHLTIQLITVSSGLIVLGVTFFEKIQPDAMPKYAEWFLIVAWMSLGISILGGFWSFMAQTGTLSKPNEENPNLYGPNIILPASIQVIAFVGGIVSTILYGACALLAR